MSEAEIEDKLNENVRKELLELTTEDGIAYCVEAFKKQGTDLSKLKKRHFYTLIELYNTDFTKPQKGIDKETLVNILHEQVNNYYNAKDLRLNYDLGDKFFRKDYTLTKRLESIFNQIKEMGSKLIKIGDEATDEEKEKYKKEYEVFKKKAETKLLELKGQKISGTYEFGGYIDRKAGKGLSTQGLAELTEVNWENLKNKETEDLVKTVKELIKLPMFVFNNVYGDNEKYFENHEEIKTKVNDLISKLPLDLNKHQLRRIENIFLHNLNKVKREISKKDIESFIDNSKIYEQGKEISNKEIIGLSNKAYQFIIELKEQKELNASDLSDLTDFSDKIRSLYDKGKISFDQEYYLLEELDKYFNVFDNLNIKPTNNKLQKIKNLYKKMEFFVDNQLFVNTLSALISNEDSIKYSFSKYGAVTISSKNLDETNNISSENIDKLFSKLGKKYSKNTKNILIEVPVSEQQSSSIRFNANPRKKDVEIRIKGILTSDFKYSEDEAALKFEELFSNLSPEKYVLEEDGKMNTNNEALYFPITVPPEKCYPKEKREKIPKGSSEEDIIEKINTKLQGESLNENVRKELVKEQLSKIEFEEYDMARLVSDIHLVLSKENSIHKSVYTSERFKGLWDIIKEDYFFEYEKDTSKIMEEITFLGKLFESYSSEFTKNFNKIKDGWFLEFSEFYNNNKRNKLITKEYFSHLLSQLDDYKDLLFKNQKEILDASKANKDTLLTLVADSVNKSIIQLDSKIKSKQDLTEESQASLDKYFKRTKKFFEKVLSDVHSLIQKRLKDSGGYYTQQVQQSFDNLIVNFYGLLRSRMQVAEKAIERKIKRKPNEVLIRINSLEEIIKEKVGDVGKQVGTQYSRLSETYQGLSSLFETLVNVNLSKAVPDEKTILNAEEQKKNQKEIIESILKENIEKINKAPEGVKQEALKIIQHIQDTYIKTMDQVEIVLNEIKNKKIKADMKLNRKIEKQRSKFPFKKKLKTIESSLQDQNNKINLLENKLDTLINTDQNKGGILERDMSSKTITLDDDSFDEEQMEEDLKAQQNIVLIRKILYDLTQGTEEFYETDCVIHKEGEVITLNINPSVTDDAITNLINISKKVKRNTKPDEIREYFRNPSLTVMRKTYLSNILKQAEDKGVNKESIEFIKDLQDLEIESPSGTPLLMLAQLVYNSIYGEMGKFFLTDASAEEKKQILDYIIKEVNKNPNIYIEHNLELVERMESDGFETKIINTTPKGLATAEQANKIINLLKGYEERIKKGERAYTELSLEADTEEIEDVNKKQIEVHKGGTK